MLEPGDDLSDLSISDDSSDEVQTTTNDAMDAETTEKQGNETEATLKGPAKPVKKKQGAKKQPTTETVKPATTKGQGVKKGKPAPKIKSEKPTKTSTPKKAKKPTPVTEKQKIEPTKAQQTKTAKKSPAKSPEKAKPSPTKPKPAPKPRTSLFPQVVVGSKIKKKQPPPTPNTTPSQTAKNQRRKRRTSKSNKRKRQENDDNTPLPAAKKKKIDVVVRYDKKEFLTTMLGKDAIAKAKLLPGPEKKFFGLLGDEDVERLIEHVGLLAEAEFLVLPVDRNFFAPEHRINVYAKNMNDRHMANLLVDLARQFLRTRAAKHLRQIFIYLNTPQTQYHADFESVKVNSHTEIVISHHSMEVGLREWLPRALDTPNLTVLSTDMISSVYVPQPKIESELTGA